MQYLQKFTKFQQIQKQINKKIICQIQYRPLQFISIKKAANNKKNNSDNKIKCQTKKPIMEYFETIYKHNKNSFIDALPTSSLNYTVTLLENITRYGKLEPSLYKNIKNQINEKLKDPVQSKDLNIELCIRITDWLATNSDHLQGNEYLILESIYKYMQKLFHIFTWQEIEKVESNFMTISEKLKIPFTPIFSTMVNFQRQKLKQNAIRQTKDILNVLNIEVPNKQLNVVFQGYDSKVNLNFKNTQQTLVIYSLKPYEIESIFKAKKSLVEQRKSENIILDLPPLTYEQYLTTKEKFQTEKERRQQQLVNQGLGIDDDIKNNYDNMKKYGELSVINKENLDFYYDTYLNRNKGQFKISDTERIVYCPDNLMAKPEPLYSLLYFMYETCHQSLNDNNIIFGRQNQTQQIVDQALNTTIEDLQKQFKSIRMNYIQHQIKWINKINSFGCAFCNDNSDDTGIKTIKEISSLQEYNYNNDDQYFVDSMLNTMALQPHKKSFIAYTYNNRYFSLIEKIISNINEYEGQFNENQLFQQKNTDMQFDSEYFVEQYLQNSYEYNKISSKSQQLQEISNSTQQSEQFINKLAILSVIHNHQINQLPGEISSNQELYNQLFEQYKHSLQPTSFIKKKPTEDFNCYAYNLLFKQK